MHKVQFCIQLFDFFFPPELGSQEASREAPLFSVSPSHEYEPWRTWLDVIAAEQKHFFKLIRPNVIYRLGKLFSPNINLSYR